MKALILAATLSAAAATSTMAASEKYVLDSSHSQILFSYNHLGYSTTFGMFSGFEGEIEYDAKDPAASSVSVTFPVNTMITGWADRTGHFNSADFFDPAKNQGVTFKSTAIEVTGDNTAKITGDLTMNGITKPVVLDTVMNQAGEHPMAKKPWLGFDASGEVKRSDFDVGNFAPFVSDEVKIQISVEAMKAE